MGYPLRSKIFLLPKESKQRAVPKSCTTIFPPMTARHRLPSKKQGPFCLVNSIWMNLPWVLPTNFQHLARSAILGIWNIFRADRVVALLLRWPLIFVWQRWEQIPAVRFANRLVTAVLSD